MALRTVPVAIEHARLVEKLAPEAWIINFTNPAGLITQAISAHTEARVVGICDTPAELFFRIALALREPLRDVACEYLGLNHLGWVRAVRVRGEEMIDRLLEHDSLLRSLYQSDLFPPALIRSLRLIPTEYLFFYYRQRAAMENQHAAAATRGEELLELNRRVMLELESSLKMGDSTGALRAYRAYLNRRNASYMHLEADGTSAFQQPDLIGTFEGATGYHRIAIETISALKSSELRPIVLNVRNQGAIDELERDDVVEIPCMLDCSGPHPDPYRAASPKIVRGLTIAVKTYERLTIEAAVSTQQHRQCLRYLRTQSWGIGMR